MEIRAAEKLKEFPVYLFDKLDKDKKEVEATGAHVIPLSVGDPDRGTWLGGVLSTSQIIAIVLILGGAVLLPRLLRTQPVDKPPAA